MRLIKEVKRGEERERRIRTWELWSSHICTKHFRSLSSVLTKPIVSAMKAHTTVRSLVVHPKDDIHEPNTRGNMYSHAQTVAKSISVR